MQYLPTGNAGDGDFPANIERRYTFTEAASAYGAVMQLDVQNVAAVSTKPGGTPSVTQSVFSTLRQPDVGPTADGLPKYGLYRMAMGAVAAGAKGMASRQGYYENVPVPANVVAGDGLTATAGSNAFTRANVAVGGASWVGGNVRGTLNKIIAIALTDRSAGGTATIIFNGDDAGFGFDGQDALT